MIPFARSARGFLYLSNGNAIKYPVQMNKPKHPQTVIRFDYKIFINSRTSETKLDEALVHPLHLLILKHLDLNPIVPKYIYYSKYDFFYKERITENVNYGRIWTISSTVLMFVRQYLRIVNECYSIENRRERANYGITEKIRKLFCSQTLIHYPGKQVQIFDACIEFLETTAKGNPNLLVLNVLTDVKIARKNLMDIHDLGKIEQEKTEETEQKQGTEKKEIPYKIALLNEIGFFELPAVKNMTKVKQRELIQQLIGGTDRQIKGNINVLNPHSLDDRTRYTSGQYEETVKQLISSLYIK